MASTKPKIKGFKKGLKYISQIFDEGEKEDDFQIGLPTDVKHVAHIGWDGPTIDSPSWMKEFNSTGFQSAPLAVTGGQPKEEPEIKWVSEDSKARNNKPSESPPQDMPKPTRRNANDDSSSSSPPKKKDPTKPRRKNHSKDGSEGSLRSGDPSIPADPARKARRKKSKELGGGEGSTRPRSKPATSTADVDHESTPKNNPEPQIE